MSDDAQEIDYFGAADAGVKAPPQPVAERRVTAERATTGVSGVKASNEKGTAGGMPKVFWVIIGVIGVGGAAWLFWPTPAPRTLHRYPTQQVAVQPSASPQDASAQPSVTSDNDQAQSFAKAAATPAPTATVAQSAVAPQASVLTLSRTVSAVPSPSVAPAPAVSVMTAADGAALSARVTTLQTNVEAVQKQLDVIQASVTSSPKAARVSDRAARRVSSTRGNTKPEVRTLPGSSVKRESGVRSLDGELYSINTIGRGVAWVQAGEHIEIVQPGDRLGQVRVLAIDPVQRQIITSDGVIR